MIQLGKKNTLRVSRESEFGLFLKDERSTEVLLPNAYVKKWMKVGKEVEVFIYHDSEDRLTATTIMPKAMLDEFGFFEVVDVAYFGAFVDWGLPKDLLVPKQFQKEPFRIGEKKFLRVVYDEKTHRLVATERITKYLDHNPKGLKTNQELKALIIKKTDLGYKCIVDDKYEGLLYHNEVFEKLQIGDIKKVYLKKRRHDGFLDLSLKKLGAKGAKDTQEKLLTLLQQNGGKLPFTSKSTAEEIQEFFGISKKEFKRVLVILQEKKLISLDQHSISLHR